MATFYFPNRGAPSTTLTIAGLEKFPSSYPKEGMQSVDETPGGEQIVYDLGPDIQRIDISMRGLSTANKNSLANFIDTIVNWRESSFDFDSDDATEYNTVRFNLNRHDFVQNPISRFNEIIELRVDPA